jgi:FkbM family methyltransferase
MIPKLVKQNAFYPRARVAALSMISSPRFYTPRSAMLLCRSESEDGERAVSVAGAVRITRRGEGLSIWSTPVGEIATMDTESAEHITFLLAEFQRDVYLSGPVSVDQGAIVLDVGANIGMFTRQALREGAGHVISFEPAPGNQKALRYNVATELATGRVSIVEAGAWNIRDTLSFFVDLERPGRSSCMEPNSEQNAHRLSVAVLPIDAAVQDLSLPRVDFIKMDIEGAELKALEGAAGVLRQYKPHLAIAVEHTDDWLRNARNVRELVLGINPTYQCSAGPYIVTKRLQLAPEILYFR